MRRKNHYTILGIPRGASPEGVRSAYLRLAQECHPDHAGEASAEDFRKIQHAYDVLSDPAARREYDRQCDVKQTVHSRRADPLTRNQNVEPLIPEMPYQHRFAVSSGLFDRPVKNPRSPKPSFSSSPVGLRVDIRISAGRAAQGGDITVNIPVPVLCPECAGTGVTWPLKCGMCWGEGWNESEHTLRIRIPPGMDHNSAVYLGELTPGVHVEARFIVGEKRRAPPW